MRFKTELIADIYGLDKFLSKPSYVETYKPKVDIHWSIEMDSRDWGVKGISISIEKVIGNFVWERDTDDDGGREEGEIELDTTQKMGGKSWDIECLMDVSDSGLIYPESIDINFETMKIVVE